METLAVDEKDRAGEGAAVAERNESAQVDALLQRFPGPVVLRGTRPSDVRTFLSCLLFSALTAIGSYDIATGDHAIRGWLVVSIFGLLMIPLIVASVIWPPGALILDACELKQRLIFFWLRAPWQDVGSNFVVQPVLNPYGGFVFWVVYFHRNWRWFPQRKLNAGLSPVADLSIEELAGLIKRWRDKALSQPDGTIVQSGI